MPVGREVAVGIHAQDVAARIAETQIPARRHVPGKRDDDLAPETPLPFAGDLVAQVWLRDLGAAGARLLPGRGGRAAAASRLGGRGRGRVERAAADAERLRLPGGRGLLAAATAAALQAALAQRPGGDV